MAPILFADAISKGNPVKVFNNGNLERDFTFIDDIIEGIVRIISSTFTVNQKPETSNQLSETPYSIYNIGNGNPVKLMDFIDAMENALNKKAIKEFLPMQPGDVLKTCADISTLKKDYDYAPTTSLKNGIKKFTLWYKNYYRL
jgi:UDP-glucuronate 4-epimerase